MYARSAVARPLLPVRQLEIVRYAEEHSVPFVHDPSNDEMRYLRNRVRRDILPALERANPGFGDDLLELAARAARWRSDIERLVSRLGTAELVPGRSLAVPLVNLQGLDAGSLAVLWPAIAGRSGVRLDRRGTKRLVEFTIKGRAGSSIPLSGGASVRRTGTSIVIEAS
jgi:tRNA(Ile)-lysidine synthase